MIPGLPCPPQRETTVVTGEVRRMPNGIGAAGVNNAQTTHVQELLRRL